jgi:sarcosine oxidase
MPIQQSVIVLGLGIVGSSIAATLASRGYKVTAIEQFHPLHDRGSSHGDTRIFRRVPHEGSVYVELAATSLIGWQAWNQASGEDLYRQTGGIDAGPDDSPMVASAETFCAQYQQPYSLFSGSTFNRQYPHFNLPSHWSVIYQPSSGVVRPDATRTFLHKMARASGARLLHNTAVLAVESTSTSVSVRTAREVFSADSLIIAAGSWLPNLLPELSIPLAAERRVLAWYSPLHPKSGNTEIVRNLPIFVFDADGGWYGMTTPDGRIKIGHDKHLRQQVNPDQAPREPNVEDAAKLNPCIRNYFVGFNLSPSEMKSCIYTLTPDHNFLIDQHPSHANILIFSCCSGHGFKYAPVYGEIAADLLAAKSRPDLDALTMKRTGARVTRFGP